MGRLNFYVLWSLQDAPRQFSRRSNRSRFQVHVPLPLPQQLVIFSLGEWENCDSSISVEVLVSADLPTQRIGTLSSAVRCLTWEGNWNSDMVTVAAQKSRKGVYGKILLTVCGEVNSSIVSSTSSVQRRLAYLEQNHVPDLSSTTLHSVLHEMSASNTSNLGENSDAEIQVKVDTSDIPIDTLPVWPTDKTPRRTVISRRGHLTWSPEDMDRLPEEVDQASTPKKRRLSRLNSQEEMVAKIKTENREVSVSPSKRWSHTMCQTDSDTAVLIGGETSDQSYCQDSVWKLELENDFWFPLSCSAPEPVPLCARGHTATFDPDSKDIYVYGGLRDGQDPSRLHILNTLTWKWRLVTARGKVPNVAHHSAVFYKKELFVFGGALPSHSKVEKSCSNALYIFNPEFEMWYQPIVEGDKPLPRFGHSATLLSHRLVIFGGRMTATYLNDVHVLDLEKKRFMGKEICGTIRTWRVDDVASGLVLKLNFSSLGEGYMEYTAVKRANMPPLPRGFHAALPVSDNRIVISGGCSAIGALQDVHVFNIETNMWSSVASPLLCLKPRAGHSMINVMESEEQTQGGEGRIQCTVLVFGGSDCCGSFYNDTIKCKVDFPRDK